MKICTMILLLITLVGCASHENCENALVLEKGRADSLQQVVNLTKQVLLSNRTNRPNFPRPIIRGGENPWVK